MFTMKYRHLFSPILIGKTLARNRIFAAPTGWVANDACYQPPMEAVDYYEMKARGGAAVVTVGEATLDSEHGRCAPFELALDNPRAVMSMSVIADAIKKHGAIASCELMHPGWIATSSLFEGHVLYSSVDTEIHGGTVGATVSGLRARAMPEEIIEETIEKFANAALTVKKAGFDMVLVHAGHGWLISQFLSPKFNTRADRWGGSLENRMRLPIAICDRIKAKCGEDFPIEFRMSGDECFPGGYSIEEGIEIAKAIDNHVDIIHVSAGFHEDESAFYDMCPSMFQNDECNLEYAAEIKKHVKTPVATVGAFNDPEKMEEAIATGKADIVEMARAIIADPDLPNKARAGRAEDIKQCLRCFTCFSNIINKMLYTCAINPMIGRENENKYASPAVAPKKVLIAGGGIAGMQAALTAAESGHQVILCEKMGRLGGVLRCESQVAFKHKLKLYLDLQARKVSQNPSIEVRLNTPVTKELAEAIAPDAIIAAMGARPIIPTFIKGDDCKNVVGAEDVYYDISKAGKKVVVVGGGLVGSELAIHLKTNGREVAIIEMMPQLTFGDNFLHGRAIQGQIAKLGIKLALATKAVEITDEGVLGENAEGQIQFKADTIIHAIGQKPLREEVDAIRFCAPEFYEIGDCIIPANISQATKTAYYAARNLGRV
jgi:2,4-dienoyl-CoA reductase-like NADH-dependent reductase (Old Yellow Enzyme family)/thioredoxin reductase